MRVLMLSHGYPPTVSGVTLVVQRLARALVQRGHPVMVITAGKDHSETLPGDDQGVILRRVSTLPNLFWQEGPIPYTSLNNLGHFIAEFQPDLIHTHENLFLSLGLLSLRSSLEMPLVSSCYFFPSYFQHYLPGGRLYDPLLQAVGWALTISELNHYDHIVFSTNTQAQAFQEHGLQSPFSVISNGVDTIRYHPAGRRDAIFDAAVEAHFVLPPHPRLLFNGRLAKDKRIDLLIQAMPHLWKEAHAHLLLAGRGDDRPRLENLARQLGVEDCVHFLGFVPADDLPAIFRLSDVFTIASICEVQNIPCLKALASSLPIVAACAGALPELVLEGQNGYLVTPGDPQALAEAVLRVLDKPILSQHFREVSLALSCAHAERFTFDRYEQLYSDLLEQQFNSQPR
jgi:glycosyltransferase involved in cell wall biosynthesis